MNLRFLLFLFLASFLTITSCSEDDNKPTGEFQTGVFIVNEGNFLHADGSVSFLNLANSEVTSDLFGRVNDGRALGDVVQSMTTDGDRSYIVVNNSNKIEVVNANTFESISSFELSLPRNFVLHNGKGYATEWVSFVDPGRVSIIDPNDFSITSTIEVGYGAEKMIVTQEHLFVSNVNANTVSVIDLSTEEVVETIEVGNSPASFVADKNGNLWVICAGGYNENFEPLNDGKLVQISSTDFSVMKTIEVEAQISTHLLIDRTGDHLFFAVDNKIFRVGIDVTTVPTTPFIDEELVTGFYGLGIDPVTNWVYASDALGFASNGKVYRYNETGEKVDVITAGIGPNSFVFKY